MARRCWLLFVALWGVMGLGMAQGGNPLSAETIPQLRPLASLGRGQALDLRWSPDDRLVVISGVGLWWYNANDLSQPPQHQPFVGLSAFDIDADGQRLALGDLNGGVTIIDSAGTALLNWQMPSSDPTQSNAIRTLHFAPNGATLAVSTAQNVLGVYDLASGQPNWTANDGNLANVLRFSPDGKEVAIGNQRLTVDVRDTLSGKIQRSWQIDVLAMTSINDIDYSPKGDRLLIAGGGRRILALDVEFGERGYDWEALSDSISQVDWSPDGAYVAIANASPPGLPPSFGVQVWRAELGGPPVSVLEGHQRPVRGIAFSPDGARLASVSDDGSLRLWDVASGAQIAQTQGHYGVAQAISLSADGRLLASTDGTIRLWDVASGQPLQDLGHEALQTAVALLSDGRIVSAGRGLGQAAVFVWDTSGQAQPIVQFNQPVDVLTASPDGRYVVASSPDGAQLARLDAPGSIALGSAALTSCAVRADAAQVAAADASGKVMLYQPDGTSAGLALEQLTPVRALAYAPDGARLATGDGDGIVRLMQLSDQAQVWRVFLPGPVSGLAYAPNGQVLAVVLADGSLKLLDASTGVELLPQVPLLPRVRVVIFSADSTRLIGAGLDGIIHIWGV